MGGVFRNPEGGLTVEAPSGLVSGKASLEPEEEERLWSRCRQGDEEARERLILAYRPLVFWLAKRFRVPYGTYPDLVQEGMLALIFAVDHFDALRKNRFITYAYYRVRGKMINFLQRVEARAPQPWDEEDLEREAPVAYEDLEWKVDLADGLKGLPPREAEVITSLVVEGRRAADVAKEKGFDVSHVYRIQRKALQKLRSWFQQEGVTNRS